MWLKALHVLYHLPPTGKSIEELGSGLEKQPLNSCPSTVPLAYGWQHPAGNQEEIIIDTGDFIISNFVVAKRVLPPDVVKQTVADQVAKIEQQQGYAMSKREMRKMQDQVHFELLPKAFVQQKTYAVFWQKSTKKLFIGTNQAAIIDLISQSLAYCVPGWQIKVIETNKLPDRQMAAWLLSNEAMPKNLAWGEACELQDRSNRFCKFKFTGTEVDCEDIKQHVRDNMMINQAALHWDDACRFVWHTNNSITQIKLTDIEKVQDDSLTELEKLIADLSLLTPIYAKLHIDLIEYLGGEKVSLQEDKAHNLVESF